MDEGYRYMIWNDVKKDFQFPRICNQTEKGAMKELFNIIGNDARKYRFQTKKITREKTLEVKERLLEEQEVNKVHRLLNNIPYERIRDLVRENKVRS